MYIKKPDHVVTVMACDMGCRSTCWHDVVFLQYTWFVEERDLDDELVLECPENNADFPGPSSQSVN